MLSGSNSRIKRSKKLAFIVPNASDWIGGVYYYLRVARILLSKGHDDFEILLVVDGELPLECIVDIDHTSGLSFVQSNVFKNPSIFRMLFWGRDKNITTFCRDNGIDGIFENAHFLGWRCLVPVISWIPDLQHIYLPEYFSFFTRAKRTIGFTLQGIFSKRIVVSSYDARESLLNSFFIDKSKVDVVRFSVSSYEAPTILDFDILNLYNIDAEFIFLPNQFWPHKNHEIILHAIKSLKDLGVKSRQIVCSGSTKSSAYKSFESLVEKLGINEHELKILGLIPKEHVSLLQKKSKAIINPSLFEGWSTTVEEAKSLKKNLILSDISIHREQVKSNVVFFDPTSYIELANLIRYDFVFSYEDVDSENSDFTFYEELRATFSTI